MSTASYAWAKIINYLEEQFTSTVISSFFEETEVLEMDEEKLILFTPNEFHQSIIQRRYSAHIQDALKELFDSNAKVKIFGTKERDEYYKKEEEQGNAAIDFNPQFSFENFIVGSSNHLAHSAAVAVTNHPGGIYNPLFIYGPPGVGKTHLLYAIANDLRKRNPNANIIYIKGEEFTNELIVAIQTAKNVEFRNKYRNADLLLMDDIQFIAGKEGVQEEFFHTFNKLYENHKQIVLTSDRKPDDMLTLQDRLKSRFLWGLTTDIQPPDYETRMAIIRERAKDLGLNLGDDVCNYIAVNITSNIRQLEGTVKKILAYQELSDMPLDLPNISRAIDDMFKVEGNALPTPSLIISQVCKFYSVDEVALRGSQRSKGIAEPRQVAMYLVRKLTNLSLPEIGEQFARDHTTVLYAITKVEKELKQNNVTMQNNVRDITANINSLL